MKFKVITILLAGVLAGCVTYGKNTSQPAIVPVKHFKADRYLGKWYEVGRVENRFERGMIKTTAEYSLNNDGTIKVVNGGFDPAQNKYRDVTGKAKFTRGRDEAALKVSFFGPFYGAYNVVALDDNYQWAIVSGSSKKYFWVLSRKPNLTASLKAKAIAVAKDLGIDPQNIKWVPQT